jgi:hypothetical protein
MVPRGGRRGQLIRPGPAAGGATGAACFCAAVAALLICAGAVGWCSPAEALSGTVHSNTAGGLNVSVDTRWVDGAGYRPVRVTVTPTAPTTTDKLVTVEFLLRTRYWPDDRYDLRVARDIELPAGCGPVRAMISLPRYPDCQSYAINVLEDGSLQQGLCTPWTQFANMPTDWGECLPAVLVVGDTVPGTSQLAALLPVEDYFGSQVVRRYNQTQIFPPSAMIQTQAPNTLPELPSVASCPIAELPQRWIDYSSLDVVCVSLGRLQQMAGTNPPAFRAVVEWTAAGGNLWVYGIGQDWHGMRSLDRLLGLARGPADVGDPAKRGWAPPDNEVYLKAVQGGLSQAPLVERRYPPYIVGPASNWVQPPRPVPSVAVPAPVGKAPPEARFLLREYEMGLVVALAAGDPFPGTVDEWRGVLNAVGPDRWLWYRRHGMSLIRENADYWNFLIPGVGLVPVTEFCVLITLFMLGIGPLNYWLLRRARRLSLLVATIPLGAAVVTAMLFAYALLADGLGTRVRVRSVTRLDQGRGQAVCWARLSYYAGLAPRQGLTFPEDVTVFPLEYLPVGDALAASLRRELIWEQGPQGEEQWFASGWLNSRTPTQFLTVRSRPSRLGLELIRPPGDAGPPRVKNGLGTRIEQLAVCADDRKLYWAEGIEPDQTVALERLTPQAQQKLAESSWTHHPRIPEGMDPRSYGYRYSGVFGVRSYRPPRYGNPALAPPTQQASLLEASLAGASRPPLEPGSYVAVVAKSPEVVLGVAAAREEASYHVILGKW